MRIAVVGFGKMGQRYAGILKERGVEVLPLDLGDALPKQRSVDGMLVCTPPGEHLQPIIHAISNEIPVLTEKPISNRRFQVEALRDVAQKLPPQYFNAMVTNRLKWLPRPHAGMQMIYAKGGGDGTDFLDSIHDIHAFRLVFGDPVFWRAYHRLPSDEQSGPPTVKRGRLVVSLMFEQGHQIEYVVDHREWEGFAHNYTITIVGEYDRPDEVIQKQIEFDQTLYTRPIDDLLSFIKKEQSPSPASPRPNNLYEACKSTLLLMDIIDTAVKKVPANA